MAKTTNFQLNLFDEGTKIDNGTMNENFNIIDTNLKSDNFYLQGTWNNVLNLTGSKSGIALSCYSYSNGDDKYTYLDATTNAISLPENLKALRFYVNSFSWTGTIACAKADYVTGANCYISLSTNRPSNYYSTTYSSDDYSPNNIFGVLGRYHASGPTTAVGATSSINISKTNDIPHNVYILYPNTVPRDANVIYNGNPATIYTNRSYYIVLSLCVMAADGNLTNCAFNYNITLQTLT